MEAEELKTNVYLFITGESVEPYADKEEAQRLFGYGEPDMVITEEEYDKAEGLFRLIDGKIVLGHTEEEKTEEKAREVRQIRDSYLQQTDVYMISDFPLASRDKKIVTDYRQQLRDLPTQQGFPDVEVPPVPTF